MNIIALQEEIVLRHKEYLRLVTVVEVPLLETQAQHHRAIQLLITINQLDQIIPIHQDIADKVVILVHILEIVTPVEAHHLVHFPLQVEVAVLVFLVEAVEQGQPVAVQQGQVVVVVQGLLEEVHHVVEGDNNRLC